MKKILTLLLAMSLLASCVFSLSSCEISGMFDGQKPSETPAPTDPAPTDPPPTDPEPEINEPKGPVYAGYEIITLEDEELIQLVTDAFRHSSNFKIGLISSTNKYLTVFERDIMPENAPLLEILEREDGADLLLWGYEREMHIQNSEEGGSTTGRHSSLYFWSEKVLGVMNEEQRAAAEELRFYWRNYDMAITGELITIWRCDTCDIFSPAVFGNEPPEACGICNNECDYKLLHTLND
jgi:hypothetical protein